jgi:hypothetical protein
VHSTVISSEVRNTVAIILICSVFEIFKGRIRCSSRDQIDRALQNKLYRFKIYDLQEMFSCFQEQNRCRLQTYKDKQFTILPSVTSVQLFRG